MVLSTSLLSKFKSLARTLLRVTFAFCALSVSIQAASSSFISGNATLYPILSFLLVMFTNHPSVSSFHTLFSSTPNFLAPLFIFCFAYSKFKCSIKTSLVGVTIAISYHMQCHILSRECEYSSLITCNNNWLLLICAALRAALLRERLRFK